MSAARKNTCTNCWNQACAEWRDICITKTCPCKCKEVWAKAIQELREQIAIQIEAIDITVARGLNVDPFILASEAIRMAKSMASNIARGKK